ncbi:MAG: ribonuclease HII [Clostridia bacterium]|nr:ribonuclease HII [Clostridia bacterium]
MNWLEFEQQALDEGYKIVCGIDEAGRGPLAGPVCAACVVLPEGAVIEGANDSKKLTEKKRDALYDVICAQALDYGIAFASEREIDEMNILQATFLAMRRALDKLELVKPDIALIDGNKTPGLAITERCIVKGDAKSANIAAASILAKVTRDRYMLEMAALYPQYHFEKHKGYGTKLHYEMIEQYGISPIHRKTFLKRILEK